MLLSLVLHVSAFFIVLSSLLLDNLLFGHEKKDCHVDLESGSVSAKHLSLMFGWREFYVHWNKHGSDSSFNGDLRLPYSSTYRERCDDDSENPLSIMPTVSPSVTSLATTDSPTQRPTWRTRHPTLSSSAPTRAPSLAPTASPSTCKDLEAAMTSGIVYFVFVLVGGTAVVISGFLSATHSFSVVPFSKRRFSRQLIIISTVGASLFLLFALAVWIAYFSQSVVEFVESTYLNHCFRSDSNSLGPSTILIVCAAVLELLAGLGACYWPDRPRMWYDYIRSVRLSDPLMKESQHSPVHFETDDTDALLWGDSAETFEGSERTLGSAGTLGQYFEEEESINEREGGGSGQIVSSLSRFAQGLSQKTQMGEQQTVISHRRHSVSKSGGKGNNSAVLRQPLLEELKYSDESSVSDSSRTSGYGSESPSSISTSYSQSSDGERKSE